MKGNKTTIAVGQFEVVDGMIAVGDPCYTNPLHFERFGAKNGKYNVYVIMSDEGGWGLRVAELFVVHEEDDFVGSGKDWEPCDFQLSVDSGSMGIFDNEYHYDHHYDNQLDDDWYDKFVCEELDKYLIVENRGVISESGYGDGLYDVDVMFEDNGETISGVKVIFINLDEEDED